MRAVLVGTVDSTRVAMRVLAARGWELAALVTLPPELASRHSDYLDLSEEAEALGATVAATADGNAPPVLALLEALGPDLTLVIGWSQICRRAFIGAAGGRVLGYHPAPLPRLRGRGVIPWTILAQEPITAGTLFWIDEGVDSGPIVAQRFLHVAPDETARSLYDRHLEVLEAILADALDRCATGDGAGEPQDERFATFAARRRPEDGRIDWSASSVDVWRLVRAVGQPYPGAFTQCGNDRLIVWRAAPWQGCERHLGAPGQVIAVEEDGFVVRCGDGAGLKILEWERAGGPPPRLHARLGPG